MHELLVFINQHMAATGVGSGVFIVALISCLPHNRPRTADEWYTFIREALQTAIPAARHPIVNPSQPEEPANLKSQGANK